MVIVDDDVALNTVDQATGARGLAGTVFIHKLVGAAAAEGKSLADVVAAGKAAVESLATMGVSFLGGNFALRSESRASSSERMRWSLASEFTENPELSGRSCNPQMC